jgi:16S rRNA G966 N2-methylase RsmD
MRDEAACRTGGLDINSGTCQAALSARSPAARPATVQSIEVKKINIAKRQLDAVTVDMNYRQDTGRAGARWRLSTARGHAT